MIKYDLNCMMLLNKYHFFVTLWSNTISQDRQTEQIEDLCETSKQTKLHL